MPSTWLDTLAPGIHRISGFFPPNVAAIQTSRAGGVSMPPFDAFNLATHVGDAPQAVAANRNRLAGFLPSAPTWLNQVHGANVVEAGGEAERGADTAAAPTADAAFTQAAGVVCGVMTADCLPVLIARADGGQVGAAHAGWRGLCAGVIEATVRAMVHKDPAGVAHGWLFWLGPAIGQAAFEVGEEVRQAFLAHATSQPEREALGQGQAFMPGVRTGKWQASLTQLAQIRISRIEQELGLKNVRVAVEPSCVFQESAQYFSFRRDSRTGRMASLIWRAPQ